MYLFLLAITGRDEEIEIFVLCYLTIHKNKSYFRQHEKRSQKISVFQLKTFFGSFYPVLCSISVLALVAKFRASSILHYHSLKKKNQSFSQAKWRKQNKLLRS